VSTQGSSWARYAALYAVVFAVLGTLDAAWLGWIATEFYRAELGPLMRETVRIVPAALYYLLYPVAVVVLALTPPPPRARSALIRGAVLGLAAFGVYDLTNLAILQGYSVRMAAVDMAWGGFATALASVGAHRLVSVRH
jgi:uncharacterized membrane protein